MTAGLDLKGKHVLVVGLGASGDAAARALIGCGAQVTVTEGAETPAIRERAKALQALGIEVQVGGHDLDALAAELSVVSPGIPPWAPVIQSVRRQGIPVWSEIELAFRLARCRFIAVTGTNGKTTTTSLIALMLSNAGVVSTAAGNIGLPLVDAVTKIPSEGAIVVEVSSFQLEAIESFRPHVAVVLNIAEDHTDWHQSFDAYIRAKARIAENQEATDSLIVNAEDPQAVAIGEAAVSRLVPFSSVTNPTAGAGMAEGSLTWQGEPFIPATALVLPGVSGIENSLAAAAAAFEYGLAAPAVVSALVEFQPLAHRMATVAQKGGVTFIDDSKATNPHATLGALRGLTDVVLIAGGRSKGVDLSVLSAAAPFLRAAVILGEAASELEKVFEGLVPVKVVDSMEAAVATAADLAEPFGSVLLSPACASLDMYESYAARGDDFIRAVRRVTGRGQRGNE